MSRKHASARRRPYAESLEPRLCLSSVTGGTSTTPADPTTNARLGAAYGQLPLSFEANQGQTDSHVNFLARGAGYTVFLTPAKTVLEMTRGDSGNVVAGLLHLPRRQLRR